MNVVASNNFLGTTTLTAGHDVTLTAGTQESTLDARQHKKIHSDSRTAQSITLTGDSITLLAGHNITSQVGNLVGQPGC